jgi:hypothetical protein
LLDHHPLSNVQFRPLNSQNDLLIATQLADFALAQAATLFTRTFFHHFKKILTPAGFGGVRSGNAEPLHAGPPVGNGVPPRGFTRRRGRPAASALRRLAAPRRWGRGRLRADGIRAGGIANNLGFTKGVQPRNVADEHAGICHG